MDATIRDQKLFYKLIRQQLNTYCEANDISVTNVLIPDLYINQVAAKWANY